MPGTSFRGAFSHDGHADGAGRQGPAGSSEEGEPGSAFRLGGHPPPLPRWRPALAAAGRARRSARSGLTKYKPGYSDAYPITEWRMNSLGHRQIELLHSELSVL